jgi:hypothetical protein
MMKTINKIGYGLLSLFTLLFYVVTNGFPRSRIFSSIKEKVLRIQKTSYKAPESLILVQPDTPYSDEYASHTSHSSHRSHASHRSGTTGTVRTAPAKKKTVNKTSEYANAYAQYLTSADVETITGLNGIQQNIEPSILHYLRDDGIEILRVKFLPKAYFSNFKNDSKYSPITGIGEVALVGTPQLPIELVFLQRMKCVELSTFPEEGLKLLLSLDQLKTAANIISSRLTDE